MSYILMYVHKYSLMSVIVFVFKKKNCESKKKKRLYRNMFNANKYNKKILTTTTTATTTATTPTFWAVRAGPGVVADAGVKFNVESSVIIAVWEALAGVEVSLRAVRPAPTLLTHTRPIHTPAVVKAGRVWAVNCIYKKGEISEKESNKCQVRK